MSLTLLSKALSAIKNAQMVGHACCVLRHSNFVENVLKVLKEEGFIISYEVLSVDAGHKMIKVDLSYHNNRPVVNKIKMLSKPGCRMYSSSKNIPQSMGGLGVVVVSTSNGILSAYDAKSQSLGGECLFEIN